MDIARWKRADLLSTTDAAIVGAVWHCCSPTSWPYATPFLAAGVTVHGVAMVIKRRLERHPEVDRPAWVEGAYWFCWVVLVGLVAYSLMRAM